MKIEFQHQWQKAHGLTRRERLIADLPRWARGPRACRGSRTCAIAGPGCAPRRARTRAFGAAQASGLALRCVRLARHADGDHEDADVVLFVDTFTATSSPRTRARRCAVLGAAGIASRLRSTRWRGAVLRAHVSHGGPRDEARPRATHDRGTCACRRARGVAIVGLEPSCLCRCATNISSWASGRREAHRRAGMLIEEFLAAEQRRAPPAAASRAAGVARAPSRALPPEGVRRAGPDGGRAAPGAEPRGRRRRVELLRHGRQLRLRSGARGRIARDGGAVAAAARCATPMRAH
jgi:hypothetical protein